MNYLQLFYNINHLSLKFISQVDYSATGIADGYLVTDGSKQPKTAAAIIQRDQNEPDTARNFVTDDSFNNFS